MRARGFAVNRDAFIVPASFSIEAELESPLLSAAKT